MFKPIITNAPTPDMLAYNKLISRKPTTGTLAEKIEKQRAWRHDCLALLEKMKGE